MKIKYISAKLNTKDQASLTLHTLCDNHGTSWLRNENVIVNK